MLGRLSGRVMVRLFQHYIPLALILPGRRLSHVGGKFARLFQHGCLTASAAATATIEVIDSGTGMIREGVDSRFNIGLPLADRAKPVWQRKVA